MVRSGARGAPRREAGDCLGCAELEPSGDAGTEARSRFRVGLGAASYSGGRAERRGPSASRLHSRPRGPGWGSGEYNSVMPLPQPRGVGLGAARPAPHRLPSGVLQDRGERACEPRLKPPLLRSLHPGGRREKGAPAGGLSLTAEWSRWVPWVPWVP